MLDVGDEQLRATPEHPFYVAGAWKEAGDLAVGDVLINREGEQRSLVGVEHVFTQERVYNFEVSGWHTYFVGLLAWLVHNARPCLTKIRHLPDWLARMWKGNYFNYVREQFYKRIGGFNEVVLANGKRVDSYIPRKEIISRKFTQLSEVTVSTAKKYLDEMVEKYRPGTPIKNTARNAEAMAHSPTLQGKMILEVPRQKGAIPKEILEHAAENKVIIRSTDGIVHKL